MFTKSKISQSMIDAVNKVLEQTQPEPEPVPKTPAEGGRVPWVPNVTILSEASPIKEPTSTGMRVYGSSYGNSAKAKKDQTKSPVDNLKGPKDKEMKKAAKPDFLDMDKDGNKKESMKKAVADKGMKEELKGNQHRIDANNNNKIDAQDFKILQAKKKVKEEMSFAKKLLETVRKSDVPAYLRKAKGDTPLTVADAKGPKKDSISAPENLAKNRNEEIEHINELKKSTLGSYIKKASDSNDDRSVSGLATDYADKVHWDADEKNDPTERKMHLRSKGIARAADKLTKEEIEQLEEGDFDNAKKQGWSVSQHYHHTKVTHPKHGIVSVDRYGEWMHHPDQDYLGRPKGDLVAHGQFKDLNKHLSTLKEGSYEPSDAPITTDTLAGRMPGGKSNSFKSYKLRVRPLDKEGEHKPGDDTPATIQPKKTPAMKSHEVHEETIDEITIAGTPGWKEMKKDVKDKSGAVHTPMSRAKDLARLAFKKIQKEVK